MALLQNKIALVTGGTRGIGRTIVERMIAEGAKVAFTYHRSTEQATALMNAYPSKAIGYQSDAADFSAAQSLLQNVVKDFGQLDILVNNAGITRDNLLIRMTEQQWNEVIHTNLTSVFNLTKVAMRHFLKKRAGSIVNLTSVVGIQGNAGQSNYAASKAGIIGFTKSIAKEVGSRNIRCNAVAPGFIETDMTQRLPDKTKQNFLQQIPFKRFGTTEEVANTIIFLASDFSTYVSGQVIGVCGGLS